jgi:hypothetical protein
VEKFLASEDSRQRANAICFLALYLNTAVVEHLIYDPNTCRVLVEEVAKGELALDPVLMVLLKVGAPRHVMRWPFLMKQRLHIQKPSPH